MGLVFVGRAFRNMSSKKPAKDKSNETQSTQPVTRPTQSSVHRLYETGHGAGGCSDDHFEAEKPRKSSTFHVWLMLNNIQTKLLIRLLCCLW